jgi:O-antigen ligase
VELVVRGLRNPRLRLVTLLLALTTVAMLVVNWKPGLNLLDRSPVLSGRVKIWSGSTRWALESLWWGHGFSHVEPPAFENTVHSHNGVLNLVVQLGIVGCFLLLWDGAWCVLAGLRQMWGRPLDFHLAAPLLYLLFYFLMNLVEVSPPHAGHFSEWILYVAATQLLVQRFNELEPSASPNTDSSEQ